MKLEELFGLARAEGLEHVVLRGPARAHALRACIWTADEIWQVFYDDERGEHVEIDVHRLDRGAPPDLEELRHREGKAWLRAGEELGLEVTARFVVRLPSGREIATEALVPHVGSPKGTLIFGGRVTAEEMEAADAAGFHVPGLNPLHYGRYERETFREALADWGWAGPEELRPDWMR